MAVDSFALSTRKMPWLPSTPWFPSTSGRGGFRGQIISTFSPHFHYYMSSSNIILLLINLTFFSLCFFLKKEKNKKTKSSLNVYIKS